MNKLHGRVLELFRKDKNENKISNIVYGKKALDKYVDVAFKGRDEKDRKQYMKQWDSSKLGNSVYFVYDSKRGKQGQIRQKGHRFISNASKSGDYSYLGHLESNNKEGFKKRKSVKRRKKTQRGGMVPCVPCAAAMTPMLSSGIGLGAAALGTGYYVSKSSSSTRVSDGGKNIKRKEIYEIMKNGKKKKKIFIQDGKNVIINGKKSKSRSLKNATKKLNTAIKRCVKSGFKKC